MTAAELSAAQWRALNNMASGYPALAVLTGEVS